MEGGMARETKQDWVHIRIDMLTRTRKHHEYVRAYMCLRMQTAYI